MQDASNGVEPIRSEFADDPDMLELVQEFVAELPGRVDELSTSLSSGDSEQLQRIAHQLSGACGGYGFPAIGDMARALENRLRDADGSAELTAVREQVDELVEMCRRVVA